MSNKYNLIQAIDDSVNIAESEVLTALVETYTKAAVLLEMSNTDVSSFDIFNESVIMEFKKNKKEEPKVEELEKPKDPVLPKETTFRKLKTDKDGNKLPEYESKIKSILLAVIRLFQKIFELLTKKKPTEEQVNTIADVEAVDSALSNASVETKKKLAARIAKNVFTGGSISGIAMNFIFDEEGKISKILGVNLTALLSTIITTKGIIDKIKLQRAAYNISEISEFKAELDSVLKKEKELSSKTAMLSFRALSEILNTISTAFNALAVVTNNTRKVLQHHIDKELAKGNITDESVTFVTKLKELFDTLNKVYMMLLPYVNTVNSAIKVISVFVNTNSSGNIAKTAGENALEGVLRSVILTPGAKSILYQSGQIKLPKIDQKKGKDEQIVDIMRWLKYGIEPKQKGDLTQDKEGHELDQSTIIALCYVVLHPKNSSQRMYDYYEDFVKDVTKNTKLNAKPEVKSAYKEYKEYNDKYKKLNKEFIDTRFNKTEQAQQLAAAREKAYNEMMTSYDRLTKYFITLGRNVLVDIYIRFVLEDIGLLSKGGN